MNNRQIVHSLEDLNHNFSLRTRIRNSIRNSAILAFSLGRSIDRTRSWIRFPYYHHVFQDEEQGFKAQLNYLSNYGDFLSLEAAIDVFDKKEPINGRYFCVTFDDGLRSCYDNALPILAKRKIPAAFFITTGYIADAGLGEERICRQLYPELSYSYEYLTWGECAEMLRSGMTIGSHTCSHSRLADLNSAEAKRQIMESKSAIEEKLGIECKYFACPYGRPDIDFGIRDVNFVREAGYKALLTTGRGKNESSSSPFAIKRDHMYANWRNFQLRYFFSL